MLLENELASAGLVLLNGSQDLSQYQQSSTLTRDNHLWLRTRIPSAITCSNVSTSLSQREARHTPQDRSGHRPGRQSCVQPLCTSVVRSKVQQLLCSRRSERACLVVFSFGFPVVCCSLVKCCPASTTKVLPHLPRSEPMELPVSGSSLSSRLGPWRDCRTLPNEDDSSAGRRNQYRVDGWACSGCWSQSRFIQAASYLHHLMTTKMIGNVAKIPTIL